MMNAKPAASHNPDRLLFAGGADHEVPFLHVAPKPDASDAAEAADAECTEICAMLIEAWSAAEQTDGALFDTAQSFSFCDMSDSGEARCDTETRFPILPNTSAAAAAAGSNRMYQVCLGLMTVRGLIEISQATLRRSQLSGDARDEAWLALAYASKVAGQAACAAILRLADRTQINSPATGPSESIAYN